MDRAIVFPAPQKTPPIELEQNHTHLFDQLDTAPGYDHCSEEVEERLAERFDPVATSSSFTWYSSVPEQMTLDVSFPIESLGQINEVDVPSSPTSINEATANVIRSMSVSEPGTSSSMPVNHLFTERIVFTSN